MDCDYHDTSPSEYEKAYVDILSTLVDCGASTDAASESVPGIPYETLRERVDDELTPDTDESNETVLLAAVDGERGVQSDGTDGPTGWVSLHNDCLAALKYRGYVVENEAMGGLYLTDADDRTVGVIPTFDPIQTVFEYGPIDGCKDISVYTMVSWCELAGLSWDATVQYMQWWLDETGRWASEDWAEASVHELCKAKRHIHEDSMGWGDYPEVAKNKMETSPKNAQLDAHNKSGAVDRTTFE
jgi:hypothetical protein